MAEDGREALLQEWVAWSPADVGEWVAKVVQLPQHRLAFERNEVDGPTLLELDEEVLENDLHIDNVIQRKKIIAHLKLLRCRESQAPSRPHSSPMSRTNTPRTPATPISSLLSEDIERLQRDKLATGEIQKLRRQRDKLGTSSDAANGIDSSLSFQPSVPLRGLGHASSSGSLLQGNSSNGSRPFTSPIRVVPPADSAYPPIRGGSRSVAKLRSQSDEAFTPRLGASKIQSSTPRVQGSSTPRLPGSSSPRVPLPRNARSTFNRAPTGRGGCFDPVHQRPFSPRSGPSPHSYHATRSWEAQGKASISPRATIGNAPRQTLKHQEALGRCSPGAARYKTDIEPMGTGIRGGVIATAPINRSKWLLRGASDAVI